MTTDTDPLLLTQHGFVATITINRAEQLNVWSPAMARMLEDLVRRCAADNAVRVIVFTGAGSTFCAGADLAALKAAQAAGVSPLPPRLRGLQGRCAALPEKTPCTIHRALTPARPGAHART